MGKYTFDQVTTKNGDGGKSSNYDGEYYSKDDLLFETLGELDELSSWLGKVRIAERGPFLGVFKMINGSPIDKIQLILQYGGSLVATNPRFNSIGDSTNTNYIKLKKITTEDIDFLEKLEKDLLESGVKIENGFILPGKTALSADIDIARAVCRRVERAVVRYMIQEKDRYDLKHLSMYLNRLSDLLFILARKEEQK